jgi:hypothetical protein
MSITVEEVFGSQGSGSIDAVGNRTVTRTYQVLFTTDEVDTSLDRAIDALDAVVCPHGDKCSGSSPSIQLGRDEDGVQVYAYYYGQRSWKRANGNEYTWFFDLEFSTTQNLMVSVETQGDTKAVTKNVWRSPCNSAGSDKCSGGAYGQWTAPDGGWDEPTKGNIGGNPVDSAGTPTTITTIDRRFNTTERRIVAPKLDELSSIVGTRNPTEYEGAEAGTVLYLGFSWNYDFGNSVWVVTHQFAVDKQTHHCEQVPKCNPSGDIITKKYIDGDVQFYAATHVYWVQPFVKGGEGWSILPDF